MESIGKIGNGKKNKKCLSRRFFKTSNGAIEIALSLLLLFSLFCPALQSLYTMKTSLVSALRVDAFVIFVETDDIFLRTVFCDNCAKYTSTFL